MSIVSKKKSAIVHVDGDAFFAYCEVAQNEMLRGKPVVTGQEKGMAIAVSYEAKALGISRGMLMSEIRKLVPGIIILPSNYDLYKIYCRRMYAIVGRYAPIVEEYSIDECFADISSLSDSWEELVEIARKIKHDLEQDLGMTFSLGLGPTKTLAKVASKWKKPAGFTAMQPADIETFLKDVPIGAVWGIGTSLSISLQKHGIKTAGDFTQKPQAWVEIHFSKPVQELWYELNGIAMHNVHIGNREKHQSIRATRTFRPPSKDRNYILSELAKNAEKACLKLRRNELEAKTLYFYLKTQTFRYFGKEIVFNAPTCIPGDIMNAIIKEFDTVFKKDIEYRASGIVLHSIKESRVHQLDLFGMQTNTNNKKILYKSVDTIFNTYGRGSIFMASSLQARLRDKARHRSHPDEKIRTLCQRMGIPYWGNAL